MWSSSPASRSLIRLIPEADKVKCINAKHTQRRRAWNESTDGTKLFPTLAGINPMAIRCLLLHVKTSFAYRSREYCKVCSERDTHMISKYKYGLWWLAMACDGLWWLVMAIDQIGSKRGSKWGSKRGFKWVFVIQGSSRHGNASCWREANGDWSTCIDMVLLKVVLCAIYKYYFCAPPSHIIYHWKIEALRLDQHSFMREWLYIQLYITSLIDHTLYSVTYSINAMKTSLLNVSLNMTH